ncbi:prolyl oligopeptidase family serine peptidase [archaeon]|nr:prolyl oligopeptidase family serine peptidase [archaeon]
MTQSKHVFTRETKYLLYLPEGYSKEEKYPLLVFLHGAGERGDDLELVKIHGPPKLIEAGHDFPFIIVSPQVPLDEWWSPDTVAWLTKDIMDNYSVDTERVYLTGLSMGGFGTWRTATKYPEMYAAIAPICGGGDPSKAHLIKDVPVWVFHGAKDDVVPIKRSEEMYDALKEYGNIEFTVYPEANHDSWTKTYENPRLYEWLLSHKRESNSAASLLY